MPVALLSSLLFWVNSALAGVVLVPTAPLVADGVTTSTVRLYVEGGGSAKAKIKPDTGKLGPVISGADGIITFSFTPVAATAVGVVNLKVNANGEDSVIALPVVPPNSGRVTITVDPPVLAASGSATIRVQPQAAGPFSGDGRSFRIVASAGTIDSVSPGGGGSWVAHYTPPKGLTKPMTVVISAGDAAAPEATWGVTTLPVVFRRSVSVDVTAGSSNVLVAGDRTYGPVIAAPSGKVAFDVDLDPRQPRGQLTSVNPDTSRVQKDIDLPDVSGVDVAWLAGRTVVPAGTTVNLRLATSSAGGVTTANPPTLTATAGTFGAPVVDAESFLVSYTAPATLGDVILAAVIGDRKTELKLHVVAGAGSMTLVTEPAEIATKGTSVVVTARLKDAAGSAVVGHAPFLSAEGGTISALKDNKDGSYTGTVKLTSATTNLLRVWGIPALEATGLAPSRLVIWPSTSTVAANGTDAVALTVLALDAYGLPVPNVTLKLSVPHGDGSLPPEVKTDAHGLGRTTFRAGKVAGLVSLRAEGAGLWTEAPIVQATGPSPVIPVGGPPDIDALLDRWRSAAPETLAIRAGTAPLSGPPASVSVSTVPPYTTPGANILVTVRVADSAGKGVPGQKLAISASPATVGAITDNHDGSYTFAAQLPAGVDGPLAISAGAASALGRLDLPTLANAAAVAAPIATSGGATGSATGGQARATAAPSEFKQLRIGAAISNAHGSYTMTGNGAGGLLGGADYGAPALGFTGVDVDATWWPVHAKFGDIGFEARAGARVELYNVLDTVGVSVARDVIAGARYRRGFGPLSVQGGLAFHYTTGNVFAYTPSFTGAEPAGLPLLGARVAAIGGFEKGKVYAGLEAAESFLPFPCVTRLGGLFEYALTDNLGLRVGAAWDYRSMKFATSTGGEAQVVQSQLVADLGVGFGF